MEAATTLAELLLSEPEILAWLEVDPSHRNERALFEQAPPSAAHSARYESSCRPPRAMASQTSAQR